MSAAAFPWLWVLFGVLVTGVMILDLGVFNRRSHSPSLKEALIWCGVWVGLALLFNAAVYFWRGQESALLFLTGYLVEESLSVDNLFVFLLVFESFMVPPEHQHKVLFWGIIGAMLMRAVFILTGITLLNSFHWIIYVFGGFLVITGLKLLQQRERKLEPKNHVVIRCCKSFLPITENYEGGRFFVRRAGGWLATPLFVVLLVVESTDVVFATDSIPAILSITQDPFIVYTSNIFAILGLRALFFALAGLKRMFVYLNYGLAVILAFIGVKMLISDVWHIPVQWALAVIASVLMASIAASLVWKPREPTGA